MRGNQELGVKVAESEIDILIIFVIHLNNNRMNLTLKLYLGLLLSQISRLLVMNPQLALGSHRQYLTKTFLIKSLIIMTLLLLASTEWCLLGKGKSLEALLTRAFLNVNNFKSFHGT
jgi:hypothetical protein